MIDRLIDWLIEWLIDWLIDWLIGWLVGWFIDWLIGRSIPDGPELQWYPLEDEDEVTYIPLQGTNMATNDVIGNNSCSYFNPLYYAPHWIYVRWYFR